MHYWAMKTLKDWADGFFANPTKAWIGIDQSHFDSDYRSISTNIIDNMVHAETVTRAIVRFFDQFCYDMQIGDIVVIGVGSTTNFNVRAIVRIKNDYEFDPDEEPRHIRCVEIIKLFDNPIPYEELNRSARIECLTEADFGRLNSRIYK